MRLDMKSNLIFDIDLIKKYDIPGPRYTSYPTAPNFDDNFTKADYSEALRKSFDEGRELSLYFHIPFCAKICFYCGCNKIATKNTELCEPYLEHIENELALISSHFPQKRKVKQLHWGGGTPTFLSLEQMQRLMALAGKYFQLLDDDSGDYSIEIDPREANAQTLEVLRSIGFNRLSFGVQDFNLKVQEAINRVQPKQLLQDLLDKARQLGFGSINFDLIYGLPHQSLESFNQTLQEVIQMRPDRISAFNYAHLPERFKPQRRIHEEDLPSAMEKLNIFHNCIETLVSAGYHYVGMDHFALPEDSLAIAQKNRKLHRNFQGYTILGDCDLIGVGVSSIGMVSNAYIQNFHKLTDYDAALENKEFATLRGTWLDKDDEIRRALIMELMCHFSLDFVDFETKFGINFKEYFVKELENLKMQEADGLLEINTKGIYILDKGRILVRSISMIFDKYLDQNSMQVKFSRII